ncbi:uncharacterized protein BCR38DRAFT_479670 [Pseudomassariella vexata]|uniref:Spo12 family-domain-containing protein n=1 Tax=Pseudomassariella vexata TaxID=1141098 RepID=A0A1Y2EHU7_9PEZI|nr:uncharacterized protein BCR38DRAFT_479670 [Pseudomassariella vexata]ORY71151.1 hypothetical protein BCR38DRAFT_479670 [Pseudomassariella vexata]
MSSNVLASKDVNANMTSQDGSAKGDVKSMEYHRQALQAKIEEEKNGKTYVSPSDTIMSPCTAKLNAYRNKQVSKAKPKSLFAQASSKKFEGENVLGAKNTKPSSPYSS